MKKLYTPLFILFFIILQNNGLQAQGIYQFWGITDYGGKDDHGILFSARYDGMGVTPRQAFEMYTPGYNPERNDLTAYNGKLYGAMPNQGRFGFGFIYEYDPAANNYTPMANFYPMNATNPKGKMVVLNNRLYGITNGDNYGTASVLFEFNPSTGALTLRHHFDNDAPRGGLTVYNNKLYGTTNYYGFPDKEGVVFSFDPATDTYTELAAFDENTGNGRNNAMIIYNSKLYGVSASGGVNNNGTLFEFNPANNALVKIANVNSTNGNYAYGGLVVLNNKFYGVTRNGGANNSGVIYEYDPATQVILKKYDMQSLNGMYAEGDLTIYNNKLYGITLAGGNSGQGVIFEYDPVANTYSKKVNLNGSMGEDGDCGLLLLNNRLYGLTRRGGAFNRGVLFEYNPAINGYTKKIDLGNSNGYHPSGKLTYYAGKLYGTTYNGGNYDRGVIFSYDLATHTYAIRHHMQAATGYAFDHGGMLLYKNKLYGVTRGGGVNNDGVLYEFDPLDDTYTVKHHFLAAGGKYPHALPTLYNGKLYGTTNVGGNTDNGVLYEFDLATNTYTVKVHFGGSFGVNPYAPLTLYNSKLYGTTRKGGVNDGGTLFEYNPVANGFLKRHDFTELTGIEPSAPMVIFNNKLYGSTDLGGNSGIGALYEYDPSSNIYTKKVDFAFPGGVYPRAGMIVHNNKLYGMTNAGGTVRLGGVLYEYDPVTNSYSEKADFVIDNGRLPRHTQLAVVPALVAPGNPGSCHTAGSVQILAANNTAWVPFTDEEGNAVAEINANGNNLGNVTLNFYTHNGSTRQDAAGRYYLDRNITITTENQPATPVSVRFYIRKTEFESLKNTAGAGIVNVSDITVFKNGDPCTGSVLGAAVPLASSVSIWGLNYVYTAQVTGFSSFYFASKAYTALPVKLEYFNGAVEPLVNRLYWKASCTDAVDFIVERSTDGIHFTQVGMVLATQTDCEQPFEFPDQQPVEGKAWYRLQMKEGNDDVTYSNVIVLTRGHLTDLQVQVRPNPVSGSQAVFQISSPASKTLSVSVYDMTGRIMLRTQLSVQAGVQTKAIDIRELPAGVYQAVLHDGAKVQSVRFVRR